MAHCHDKLLPLAQSLLQCVNDGLVACGAPVARASLVPGSVAVADVCCEIEDGEGQLWVAVQSITPELIDGQMSCSWSYLAVMQVGVLRCSQAWAPEGVPWDPPDAQTLDDEATRMSLDAAVVREAITCCWPVASNLTNGNWSIGAWTPSGPQGGCAGGTTTVEVRFSDCRC